MENTVTENTSNQTPDLLHSLLENEQLNVEKLVSATFNACVESYISFNEICVNPAVYDHLFKKGLLYIPVSREANIPVTAQTIQEEFITTLAQVRHAFFCLLANSLSVEDETQTETLALTLAMDFKEQIDKFTADEFSTAFITSEASHECAFYALPILDLFREIIFNKYPKYWETLNETELYERAAQTMAE